ncbi:MAG: aldo/keto reductase [Acidimicrobiia bacterium]
MNHPMTTMLHGTVEMPMHGLGVFKVEDGDTVINAVLWALEAGYRLIDTAAIYRNEKGVGEAIRRSGLPRRDVFVTTKLWNTAQGFESALDALDASLQTLGFDYVDLYLIHWPKPQHTAASWRALERLQSEGFTRAIGVSNFERHHLDELMAAATVAPSVNQIELHPHLQQLDVREACRDLGTVPQAWSPLKHGQMIDDPVITGIARSIGRTPAQVVLRWQLQEGIATIPKSITRDRIVENGEVFDFTLTDDEMGRVRSLDRDERVGPHPDHITF